MKTKITTVTVKEFIDNIADEQRRRDCQKLDKLLTDITGETGKMWGTSIVGYGKYSYTRSENKFYEFMATGFSPRVQALTIYNLPGYNWKPDLMKKLGKYKLGKSCLYVKSLSDINIDILKEILKNGYESVSGKHLDYKTGEWTTSKL